VLHTVCLVLLPLLLVLLPLLCRVFHLSHIRLYCILSFLDEICCLLYITLFHIILLQLSGYSHQRAFSRSNGSVCQ
jgi:hypothetical protein